MLAILMVPALGPGVVKPCVAGTTARASSEDVRSLGYSIYYTIVNVGGALGPIVAWLVRKQLGLGIENVFRVAACSVFLMYWITLFSYREPARSGEETGGQCFRGHQEYGPGIEKSAVRYISFDFFRLLHRILAGIYFRTVVRSPVHQFTGQRGFASVGRSHRSDLPTDPGGLLDAKNARCSRDRLWLSAYGAFLGDSGPPSDGIVCRGDVRRSRDRRSDSSVPLLRIYFAARALRTTGAVHGLRISARGPRVFHRRRPGRVSVASIRRCFAAAARDVVDYYSDWSRQRCVDVVLR